MSDRTCIPFVLAPRARSFAGVLHRYIVLIVALIVMDAVLARTESDDSPLPAAAERRDDLRGWAVRLRCALLPIDQRIGTCPLR